MILAFIDESGNLHPNDDSESSVLASVMIPQRSTRALAKQLYAMKTGLLGTNDMEIKANRLLNERTFRRENAKWQFVEQIVDLIRNNDALSVFGIVIVDKPDAALMNSERNPLIPSDDYLPRHYQLLLQRINLAAREANDMALLVFDGQDAGRDKKLSRAVASFLFKSPFGRTMENLTETPLFVDSYITVGIQLADLAAGLLRLGQDNGLKPGRLFSSPYLSSVNRMHTAIRGKSRDLAEPDPQNPLTIYGIYATTAGYLFRDPPRDRDSDAVAG